MKKKHPYLKFYDSNNKKQNSFQVNQENTDKVKAGHISLLHCSQYSLDDVTPISSVFDLSPTRKPINPIENRSQSVVKVPVPLIPSPSNSPKKKFRTRKAIDPKGLFISPAMNKAKKE